MKKFKICIFHKWKEETVYKSLSNICFKSSGTMVYRCCMGCERLEERLHNSKNWKISALKKEDIFKE